MLLSRVANYLFWMGRYLERAEYSSRFIHTHYQSSLDAPFKDNRRVMLNPIIEMFGIGLNSGDFKSEENILNKAMLNMDNTASVSFSFSKVRQNALNARNVLSTELWEVINRYFHYLENFEVKTNESGQLFNFMKTFSEHAALIRSLINSTLLHDETWATIRVGIYLERAIQINKVLISTIGEIPRGKSQKENQLTYYMLQTLLKSIEAEDVYKKLHPGIPNPLLVVFFIINNNIFPRSINYNINKASQLVNRLFGINNLSLLREQPFVFDINKLASEVNYITLQDLENKSMEFLEKNIQKIENITLTLERDYL